MKTHTHDSLTPLTPQYLRWIQEEERDSWEVRLDKVRFAETIDKKRFKDKNKNKD